MIPEKSFPIDHNKMSLSDNLDRGNSGPFNLHFFDTFLTFLLSKKRLLGLSYKMNCN